MRKRFHSDPRSSRPLRLEIFEDRCLLSVANSLLAPALLSPGLLELPAIPTHGLTRVAVPTGNLLEMTAQTGADMPNGTGAAGSRSDLNVTPRLALGSIVATSVGLTGGIDATLPEMIGVTSTPSLQVSVSVQVSP